MREQLPTGSCVLKLKMYTPKIGQKSQLPTGSCVLKLQKQQFDLELEKAATYG